MPECLVLGPEGAGKTLLVEKLDEYSSKKNKGADETRDSTPETELGELAGRESNQTVPTVGVNFKQLRLTRGVTCCLRESGGQMVPLWPNLHKDCHMVIFVIDSSNRLQVSSSTILLLDVISSPSLQGKPVLVFFNKTETPLGLGLAEYKSVIRLDDIVSNATQSITVVDGSCWTGKGIAAIHEWLVKNCKDK